MKLPYKVSFPICISALLLISSCELYNPSEPVPAYIHIERFTLTTDEFTQGSNSHKITDACVYVDDQPIGCFELPATFPVISEGVHKVKVIPGIKVNGISASRAQYPFYNRFEQDVDFKVGTTINLSPTTTYNASTDFAFIEEFEAGVTISASSNSDTNMYDISDANVFEGAKSGIGYIDNTRTFFECVTNSPYVLPHGSSPVFLEFNYKSNFQFTVSVIAIGSAGQAIYPVLHINPTTDWNKIYVHLTPVVSGTYTADNYKIVWGMVNNVGLDSAAVVLDNIKLIY